MFAERPADFIPGAYVNVIREVEGTDRMTSEVFDGPAWVQALRVPDYLEETAMRTLVLRSPERTGHRTVYSWPRAPASWPRTPSCTRTTPGPTTWGYTCTLTA